MPRAAAFVLALLVAAARADTSAPAPLFPFVLPWDDATPGVCDLSGWLPRPAGRFGPVRAAADGHLYVGQQRLRLNGVDLAFSAAFPTHEQADRVAARLAKFGNNIVRFHIMDMRRYPDGLLARDAKDTRRFEPEALDRLDYFTAQLIERGVYVYLCLLNYRPFNAADGLPAEIETLGGPYQGRHVPGFWDPLQLALQKEYARDLLLHRNAYTQRTYAEDPAVAMVEINNENGLLHAWYKGTVDTLPAVFQRQLGERWNQWLAARYATTDRLRAVWAAGAEPLGNELLTDPTAPGGLTSWALEQHAPATATLALADEAPPLLPGSRSVCLTVTTPGTQYWHIRFQHRGLKLLADQGFQLSFWARAEAPGTLRTSLEQTREPWRVLGRSVAVAVAGDWRRYQVTFRAAAADDVARLVFDPPAQAGRLWLAGVSLRPGGVHGLGEAETIERASVESLPLAGLGGRSRPVALDWTRFLWDTENAYWQTLYRYLKDDLKVQGLVVGTASGYSTPNMMAGMDCVDGHAYWQHPVFPGRPWDPDNWYVDNVSMVNARGGLLADLAPKRLLGKPFCMTEYGHAAPNTYVSEGALLRNTYACLQDWDYLSTSRFSQSSNFDLRRIRSWFDLDQHPTRMVTQVPAAAMFLRGDVAPARELVVAPLSVERELELLPGQQAWHLIDLGPDAIPRQTALVHRMALATEGHAAPAEALRAAQVVLPQDRYVSDTGQLVWDQSRPERGVVTVDTPRSKAVIGYGGGQRYELGSILVEPGPTRQNGWSALTMTALDGTLEAGPARILITATGYAENTNMGWKPPQGTQVSVGKNWGEAPSLVEGIPARFTLPHPAAGVAVYALDERGQRREPVPCATGPGGQAVVAIGPQWRTLWYEVVVE